MMTHLTGDLMSVLHGVTTSPSAMSQTKSTP